MHVRLKCDKCEYNSFGQTDLKYHRRAVHSCVDDLENNGCGEKYNDKGNLSLHKNTIHIDSKPSNVSRVLGKIQERPPLNLQHTKHFPSPYTCIIRDKIYNDKCDLNLHDKSIHDMTKYKCEQSGKTNKVKNGVNLPVTNHANKGQTGVSTGAAS